MIALLLAVLAGCPAMTPGWLANALAPTEHGVRVRIISNVQPYDVADILIDGDEQRFIKPLEQWDAKQRKDKRTIDAGACRKRIPYKPPERSEAVALRPHLRVGNSIEETVGPCVEADGMLYFGLTFYEGEGSDGVGGLGRYDPTAERLEVRRPEWLRDKSVGSLATDGKTLWLGAHQLYEQSTEPQGLARYDWERDQLQPLVGIDAPCGLAVNDILLAGTTLWVSTDIGLSRLDLATNLWTHAALQRDVRFHPLDCHARYRQLIKTSMTCPMEYEFDQEIGERIARVDPAAVREVLFTSELTPKTHPAQFEALGMVIRNFAELKKQAIDRVRAPQQLQMVLEHYAQKRIDERAWHVFALKWAKEHNQLDHLRYLRGDAEVFDFLIELAKNESRKGRDAVEMLPWIDSKRAIPILLEMLTHRWKDEERMDREIIQALERAAHLRIEPDGKRTPLAANSDTPEYADEEFGAFSRHRLDAETWQKLIAQWQQWAASRRD